MCTHFCLFNHITSVYLAMMMIPTNAPLMSQNDIDIIVWGMYGGNLGDGNNVFDVKFLPETKRNKAFYVIS